MLIYLNIKTIVGLFPVPKQAMDALHHHGLAVSGNLHDDNGIG
jgi:hypothetical protein